MKFNVTYGIFGLGWLGRFQITVVPDGTDALAQLYTPSCTVVISSDIFSIHVFQYCSAFSVNQSQPLIFPVIDNLNLKFAIVIDDCIIDSDVSRVEGAVDYPKIFALTEQIVTQERFGLVESLADRIAVAILTQFDVSDVVVRVRKPDPPVQGQFDGVEVEVRRTSQTPS